MKSKELRAFINRIQKEADTKFGDDGLQIIAVDREKYDFLQYEPVPYALTHTGEIQNEEKLIEIWKLLVMNLGVAHRELDNFTKLCWNRISFLEKERSK